MPRKITELALEGQMNSLVGLVSFPSATGNVNGDSNSFIMKEKGVAQQQNTNGRDGSWGGEGILHYLRYLALSSEV